MCVSSERPLTSPIAYSQSKPGTRRVSSTSIGPPGRSPIVSKPTSSVQRPPTDGHEQLVALDAVAVLELDDDPAVPAAHRRRPRAGADVDPELAQRRRHLLARERLLADEDPLEQLDQRRPRAERRPRLRELDADHAAA
jgi:hypothetical protein